MSKIKLLAVALASLASVSTGSARAELKNTYTSMTGPQLAAVLRTKGYQADLQADNSGDPLINSGSSGTHFTIWFGECDKAPVRSCKLIEFRATFTNDKSYAPSDANRCNNKYMFGRVEIYDSGIAVTYGIPIVDVDDEYIQTALDDWAVLSNVYQTCMTNART